MGKRNRAALLPTNIPQLQNLIKRDPTSYKDEFIQQLRHYESSLAIFQLKPSEEAREFGELVTFISQVAPCYPEDCAAFPQQIMDLLQQHYAILNHELRKCLVNALILLRNRDIISSTSLLSLFFVLFRCRDKSLRDILYTHIVNDIRNTNAKHKNNKLNRTLQSFMYTMLQSATDSESAVAAKKSLDVCVELYRKNVWNDAKTVNIIAEACFAPVTKIYVTAMKFFLGTNEDQEEESDDENLPDIKGLQHKNQHGKKTRSKAKKYEKALATIKKKQKGSTKAETFNFSALHLMNDPQGFAEKLFTKLNKSNDRFEVKLMTMNLISRVIGVHKLSLLSFYSFVVRYLQPHQRDVTLILAIVAQSAHELVPPEELEPIVKAIANNFVTEHCANEVMAAGLNGIREICARCPLAMTAELLQDLTEYKSSRDKGVMMAARSLIGLFREVNPELLKKRDRGKAVSMGMKEWRTPQFGEKRAAEGIEGLELLEEYKEQLKKENGEEDGEDNWDEWEVASVSESSDGEWINVSSDDDDIHLSDDENEGSSSKNKKQEADENKLTPEEEAQRRAEEEARREAAKQIAMSKILTPQDFALLNELRTKQTIDQAMGTSSSKRKRDDKSLQGEKDPDFVDESTIIGYRKKAKADYDERIASIMAGREGREKYGSRKGKEDRGSTTNKEKAKNKAFMMVIHKRSIMSKKKMSLRDKQIQLRAHINRQKKKK
ncbi:uncharacterized protein VTP21DRAFT_8092 [Calcarisporiella thermophila]|uniref:uncharacterized protein n=1 Tax=Calcarisporiella thermophila TaxID=911321 RepID=UPI003741F6A9